MPSPALPALVDHLLAGLGLPGGGAMRSAPDLVEPETSATEPPLEWERRTWTREGVEMVLRLPRGANRELRLRLRAPDLEIELAGPGDGHWDGEVGVGWIRAQRAPDAERARVALDSFFDCPDVVYLRPRSFPKAWSRVATRFQAVPRAELPLLPGGESARLASARRPQPDFLLASQPEGHLLLGQLSTFVPVRLTLELEAGRPLPRLDRLLPLWADIGVKVEPSPDSPPEDRTFGEKDWFGLLRARHGARGRERLHAALHIDDLVREARFTTAADAARLDPDDACAPWTVEWCISGSINMIEGHPGGLHATFARSLPPAAGARRSYEIILFGTTPISLARWREVLANVGLG